MKLHLELFILWFNSHTGQLADTITTWLSQWCWVKLWHVIDVHNAVGCDSLLVSIHNIITVQETKLITTSKTPNISNYTSIWTDRDGKLGWGLLTYIMQNLTFTDLNIPTNINTHNTELEMVRIHTGKHTSVSNLCSIISLHNITHKT